MNDRGQWTFTTASNWTCVYCFNTAYRAYRRKQCFIPPWRPLWSGELCVTQASLAQLSQIHLNSNTSPYTSEKFIKTNLWTPDSTNFYFQIMRCLNKLITTDGILHGLIFDQEDRFKIFLRNIRLSKNSTALKIRRQ